MNFSIRFLLLVSFCCFATIVFSQEEGLQFLNSKLNIVTGDLSGTPNIKQALFDQSQPDIIYFYTDSPSHLYKADISQLKNLNAGTKTVNITSNRAIIPGSDAINAGVYDTANGLIFLAGLQTIYKTTDDLVVAPNTLNVDGDFQPYAAYVNTVVNNSVAYFFSFSTPTTVYSVNLKNFNETKSSTFSAGGGFPATERAVTLVTTSQANVGYLISQSGDVDVLNFGLNLANIRIASFQFTNTSGTKLKAASLDEGRNILFACGQNEFDQPIIYVVNVTGANSLSGYHAPMFSAVVGRESETCEAVGLDTYGGQAFFGLQELNAGKILRFDARNFLQLELHFIESDAEATVPTAFIVTNNQTRRLVVATQSEALGYTYPTSCLNDCSGNGKCEYSKCVCTPEYIGEDCSESNCETDCGASLSPPHGFCSDGKCICDALWTNETCGERRCPSDCHNNGICDTNTWNCTCTNPRFQGIDCGEIRLLPCNEIPTEDECIKRQNECGWCESASGSLSDTKCKKGNVVGPVEGSCLLWYTKTQREIGVIIFACIFLAIVFLMILINTVTSAMADFNVIGQSKQSVAAEARMEWWRDERSSYAWHLYDTLQFVPLFIMMSVNLPTRLISFAATMNFLAFGLPIPNFINNVIYNTRDPVLFPTGSRELLTYEQYANFLGGGAEQVFYATLIWSAIALLVFPGFFFLLSLVGWVIKRENAFDVFISRVIRIAVRIISIAYTPIVITAASHLKSAFNLTLIAAIVVILVIGIGWPAFCYFVSTRDKRLIFDRQYRVKFGLVFGAFHFQHSYFGVIVAARKLLFALLYGFFTFSFDNKSYAIGQLVGPAIVIIVYLFLMLIRNPYLDPAHKFFDVFSGIFQILVIATAFISYSSPSEITEYIFALLQIILMVVTMGMYVNSWLILKNVHSCKQLCGGGK